MKLTLILIGGLLVAPQFVVSQARIDLTKEQANPDQYCGEAIQGLQLCTSSESIKVKHGDSVEFDLILKNLTDKNLNLKPSNPFDSGLLMTIADDKGEKVPTILESFQKIKQERQLTSEESAKAFQFCCLDHAGFKGQPILPKGEELKSRPIINDYDLSKKGKYFVDIGRRVANLNGEGDIEVWLRRIAVEVK